MDEFKIKTLYEDNHLLVVEKPANMLTQGDKTGDVDLLTLLKDDIKRRYNKPGNVYLGLVHRLDRPVGGVMVFAKTSKAASRLSEQIRSKSFKKTYLAVVNGRPEPFQGSLDHFLLKDRAANIVKVVPGQIPGAKQALLDYRVIQTTGGLSLVEIDLHTGRPHQIRVQLSAIGCPLYGDHKYGTERDEKDVQIALWSTRIVCRHPTLKEEMVFESLPPDKYPWNLFELYVV